MNANNQDNAHTWSRLLEMLEAKYQATGQELEPYLEGLLYQDYVNYWDYIHLDTLLSLQVSRTQYPDEQIFIIYHQITELNFKLILSELGQVSGTDTPTDAFLLKRVDRINRYMEHLIHSFSVMTEGMDQEQFLRFRMALLPASGFQSVQFRLIEIACTDGYLLVAPAKRTPPNPNLSIDDVYANIYWRRGATQETTGLKTLTLQRFEAKYQDKILRHLAAQTHKNLRQVYIRATNGQPSEALKASLLKLDSYVNVDWRHMHLRSAVRYLQRSPEDIAATGGTNWRKYLPPAEQQNRFFPELGPFTP